MLTMLIIFGIIGGVIWLQMQRLPDRFHYSRDIIINATPERIFPEVNNLKRWAAWSPFVALDPQCKYTFEGPAEGEGASNTWDGNRRAGKGRMTITESVPYSRIVMRLEFEKPMQAINQTVFTFEPQPAGGTRVTWAMSGDNTKMMGRIMQVFVDCEKICGGMFAKGLADLKTLTEDKA